MTDPGHAPAERPSPVAVVTGAGSGIGRVVSEHLLDAGYAVVLAGRTEHTLRATAGERPHALVVPTDVTAEGPVRALFARAAEHTGRIDLLFNNAGSFGVSGRFEDLTAEQWNAIVGVNLTGSFLCAREAYRRMKQQDPRGGRIINNGSISAHVPRPGAIAYTASKHAITGLTRAISLEGRAYAIACGQIDIGNAATDMTEAMVAGVPQADGSFAAEPRMDARHVGEAVVYMAGLPPEANVQFMTVLATTMPYIGRG